MRGRYALVLQGAAIRGRQGLAVDLAVRRQRQALQRDKGRRDHVLRQTSLEKSAQLRGAQRLLGDQIGDQTFIPGAIFA